jgi:hypothetical protein
VAPADVLPFGEVCRGDARTCTLTLENKGALATTWTLALELADPGLLGGGASSDGGVSNTAPPPPPPQPPFRVGAGTATTGRLAAYASVVVPLVFAPVVVGNAGCRVFV